MKSVIYESDMHGCCGVICHLYCKLAQVVEELKYEHVRLAMCGEEWHNLQIVDHHDAPDPTLQFDMNWIGDALMMLHQHSALPYTECLLST